MDRRLCRGSVTGTEFVASMPEPMMVGPEIAVAREILGENKVHLKKPEFEAVSNRGQEAASDRTIVRRYPLGLPLVE